MSLDKASQRRPNPWNSNPSWIARGWNCAATLHGQGVVPARPNGACARRRHACQMSVSQRRSPQKPRLLQSHDVPGLRLLCVERSPLSTRLVSHKIQSQRKFRFTSGIVYHSSSQTFTSIIISTKERSHWNSLVRSWSSPSFRRGTSSNRAITTSRGLPAYLGTKYPGTFLNSQHQQNRVHLPAVLLPVCHQATTHRTLLLGPASTTLLTALVWARTHQFH